MRSGFTLTELMISIALSLVLIAGVSQVFRVTSDVVSAGQAISEQTREAISTYQVLRDDLRAIAHDAPFLAVVSGVTQSHIDDDSFRAGDAPSAFRTDRLILFTRGMYHRQTGNDGELMAAQAEREAYIWIGHPTIDGQSPGQGDATSNPENYAASKWSLGRVAVLLSPDPSGRVADIHGDHQRHFAPGSAAITLKPFTADSRSDDGAFSLPQSRYDVANTSIPQYRWHVQHAALVDPDWWVSVCDVRFDARRYVPRPIASEDFAYTTPLLASNISEFVVEFAGDWLTQDVDGNIVALEPDGVTDYVVDGDARSIRWYGMARDVDGDGDYDVVPLGTLAGAPAPFEKVNTATDYVVVWGDTVINSPSHLRLIVTQTDPRGRLAADGVIEVVSRIK